MKSDEVWEPFYIENYRKRSGRFPVDYQEIAEQMIMKRHEEYKRWFRENNEVWHERGK